MKRTPAVLLALVVAWFAASPSIAAHQATPTGDGLEIRGTITAKGRGVFFWVRDELCNIVFSDYDFTPELVVTNGDGKELASLPLASLPGVVTMEGLAGDQHAEICTVPYTLEVPAGDTYRVGLDPYFESEELAGADLAEDFDLGFERQEGDPAPDFHDRPSGPIPGTDLFRIAGTLEILAAADDRPSFLSIPLGGCVTTGGYEDIKVGAQITVRDQTGTILGIGELEPIYTDMFKCEFAFTIDVPDATFYTIEMGRRGELTYSKQDLEQADWHVDSTIGP